MKLIFLYLRNSVFLLLTVTLFSTLLIAQKKPVAVNLDSNGDDDILCGYDSANNNFNKNLQAKLRGSQFCSLYQVYIVNKNKVNDATSQRLAKDTRNEMVYIVQGQIDSFYKFRKDSRSTKIRVFQTILDFLRIGGDLAVIVMNGERAKTIIGAGLASMETGATKFDKNFQILQTQVLINKMNAKRAQLLTKILLQTNKPISAELTQNAYTWYQAKNDLRDYLLAGTFDDALDTLVEESGAEVKRAEKELEEAQKPATESNVSDAKDANKILVQLGKQLKGAAAEKDSATKTLRDIINKLMKNTEIAARLANKNIVRTSEGQAIWDALFQLRGELYNKTDLEVLINNAIIETAQ